MWRISAIKANALNNLTPYYFYALGVVLVSQLLTLATGSLALEVHSPITNNLNELIEQINANYRLYLYASIGSIISNTIILLLLQNPLTVGVFRFFHQASQGNITFRSLAYSFSRKTYLPILKTTALCWLKIFLWSLLLFIPGIVKSYQYYFVNMILCDQPKLSPKKALLLSRRLTDGQKAKILLFNLSFIPIFLIGILVCGIGLLLILPYYYAANIQLYQTIKGQAFADGILSAADFEPGEC